MKKTIKLTLFILFILFLDSCIVVDRPTSRRVVVTSIPQPMVIVPRPIPPRNPYWYNPYYFHRRPVHIYNYRRIP